MNKSETDYQRLFEVIREDWEAIEEDAIYELIKNMNSRINAVILIKGWYTRF